MYNKLYVIKWCLSSGYVVSVSSFWDPLQLAEKIAKNPEWDFKVVEDNATHKIVVAM